MSGCRVAVLIGKRAWRLSVQIVSADDGSVAHFQRPADHSNTFEEARAE